MKATHWVLVLGMALTAVGCTPSQKAAGLTVKDRTLIGAIGIEITGTAPNQSLAIANAANPACERFVAQTSDPNNRDKWRKGCFYVARGNEGSIDFNFDDPDDGNVWYFDTIRICSWTKNATSIPDDATCGMTPRQRRDYSVEEGDNLLVPDARGRIDLTNGDTVKMSEFKLTNLNTRAGFYFYWVKVCEIADPTNCLAVDPGSRNGGRL